MHIYFIHSDQAVKTLSEVWRIQNIPTAFLPPPPPPPLPTQSATATIKSLSQKHPLAFGSEQSSSISESISSAQQSTSNSSTNPTSTPATSLLPGNDSDVLPIRSFVHEVLRRSRTSGIVLQTALCYLEAVRPEVPNLLREERMGIRAYYEPESRVLPATEAEIAQEAILNILENSEESKANDDGVNTVRLADDAHDFDSEPKKSHEEFAPSTSASLPSPLLCPRRTFLASVILASKFSQDKCYSNRAWAKLSGLPPREIGRCERALGQALGWRLWVGKTLLSSHTPCSTPPLKQIVRSQSEGSILIHSIPSQFLNQENSQSSIDIPVSSNQGRGLRSCATLPVDAFVSQRHVTSFIESSKYVDSQGAIDRISNPQVLIPLVLKRPSSFIFVQSSIQSSKLPDESCGLHLSPIPITESLSPNTPGLSYSPSTSDSSSETRTVQMMFEDNVISGGNLSQPWLGANDSPSCKHSIILSTLSSGNCKDGSFGIPSVADSEAFETHQSLWYESNERMIQDPIGAC